MKTRGLCENNDWTFGNGKNNYKTGLEELKQNVLTRIRSYKNDWFLDTEANIDWISILGQMNNEAIIKQELRRVLMDTYGVLAVESIEIENNSETRQAKIRIQLRTIYDDDITNIEAGI